MTRYTLERVGDLLLTKAAISGPAGVKVVRLITGSGYLIVLQVQVSWLQCLGQKVDQMVVVAYTLPFGSLVDGLLGMDFLRPFSTRLLIAEGVIEVP